MKRTTLMILALLMATALMGITDAANKRQVENALDEMIKKQDKHGFTPLEKWKGTLSKNDKKTLMKTLKPGTKYLFVASTADPQLEIDFRLIDSNNNQVGNSDTGTTIRHDFAPFNKQMYTGEISNTRYAQVWVYFVLFQKTKDAVVEPKPEPIEPKPEPVEPKPEPIFPPTPGETKPLPMPDRYINIELPPTVFPEKWIDEKPLPTREKLEKTNTERYYIGALKGEAKGSGVLHKLTDGQLARFRLLGAEPVDGKRKYLSTVEVWLGDEGLAMEIGPNRKIDYLKVDKEGYKAIKLGEVKALPKKSDQEAVVSFGTQDYKGTKYGWIAINDYKLVYTIMRGRTLDVSIRVSGSIAVFAKSRYTAEELAINIDAIDKEVLQRMPDLDRSVKYDFKIHKRHGEGKRLLEFFIDRSSLCIFEIADDKYALYYFDKGSYTAVADAPAVNIKKNDWNRLEIYRVRSEMIIALNGTAIGKIRELDKNPNFSIRVMRMKVEFRDAE